MADARPAAGGAPARRTLPWVALGGAAGAGVGWLALRAGDALLGPRLQGVDGRAWFLLEALPMLPLLAVNTLGAFLLGLLWGASRAAAADPSRRTWDPRWVPALGTGFLGSFTSISLALGWGPWLARRVMAGELLPLDGVLGTPPRLLALASPHLTMLALMVVLGTAAAVAGLRTAARR